MAATCARFIAIQRQNTPRRHIPTPRKPRASINRSTKVDSFSGSQSGLWRGLASGRGNPAAGEAYRQRAEHHLRRAVEGPEGSAGDAVAGDARPVAGVVEGATDTLGHDGVVAGSPAVSRLQARAAVDDAAAQPAVPRDSGCGRDQEGGEPALAAAQLCDASVRSRGGYSYNPGASRNGDILPTNSQLKPVSPTGFIR